LGTVFEGSRYLLEKMGMTCCAIKQNNQGFVFQVAMPKLMNDNNFSDLGHFFWFDELILICNFG